MFPLADSQVSVSSGSQVTSIDKKVAKDFARQARKLAKQDLLDLAGKENIELWQSAIAHWMQQHQGAKVSLWQLQQALGMPLVEVWRLTAAFPYTLWMDGQGEFYKKAQEVWINDYSNF